MYRVSDAAALWVFYPHPDTLYVKVFKYKDSTLGIPGTGSYAGNL
jgi:hypothetical protein